MSSSEAKVKKLKQQLKNMRRVLIAYSGGCDSTFLLKTAIDILGKENVLAVTARSETYPKSELALAKKNAKKLGARIMVIDTDELRDKRFSDNPPRRCYYCKKELFSRLKKIARARGFKYILEGTNADDRFDFRPGYKAVKEAGAISPLKNAGLAKNDIRQAAKKTGLDTWDKPAAACLASRLPYNSRITKEKLAMVEKAEDYLRKAGFGLVRVRAHRDIARIECAQRDLQRLLGAAARKKVVAKLGKIGFKYIAVDLKGYRTGSMNEMLG